MDRAPNLLLVEDDETTRRALVRLLKAQFPDCAVTQSGDGTEALGLLIGGRYDCAFLDYRLPGQDGLEVLRGARAAGVTSPIVILTGEGSEELAVEMMKAGADDYLVKGRMTPDGLARAVRHAVRVREAESRATAARAEQAASEERFRRLVEVAEDGVWIVDAGGTTTFVNAGAARMIGYRPEEIVGRPPREFMDEASRTATVAGLGRRRQGFRERRECVMRHRDGSPVWTIVAAAPLTGPGGEYAGAFAVLTDVTHEKRTEQALRESEERFRRVFEEGPVGMAMTGLDRRLIAVNAAFGRLVGREPASLVGVCFDDITHPEDVAANAELADRMRREEVLEYRMDKRYLRPDGTVAWAALTSSVIRDAAGRPSYMLTIVEDITERRKAEEELKASEARFRSLFEASPLAISLSVGETTLYANPAYLRMFGYERADEVVGHPLTERIAPAYRAKVMDRLARQARDGSSAVADSYEAVGRRRDGSEFPYHVRVAQMLVPEGMANLAFLADLTEQKRAEAALHETSRTLEGVFAASPLAIAVLDRKGYVRMWNPAAERILGWSAGEVAGKMFPLVTASDDRDQFDDLHARLLSGRGFEGIEGSVRRKGGGMVDISVSAAPLTGADGAVTGIVVVCADMTEANRLRGQLLQSQKMESLGRLAGGIAHDFNNLLAVIGGYAESVRRRVGEGHTARPQVEEIERAAERGARLVRQLLAFSRSRPARAERVDVAAVVGDVCRMLRQVIGSRVVVERDGDGRPAWVEADPGQVEQMLVNLALNARDAMPGGGTLTFETNHLDVPAVAGSHPAGRFVALVVRDTGKGMDAPTQSRVFEPFFTTKAEGTGLGLSIVYGIVRQMGGHVSVTSEPGRGTQFEILLPAEAPSSSP